MTPAALRATASDATPAAAALPVACMRTEKLGVSYGGRAAFADVSLAIARGAVTALVGPSGCGKTTFLFCLNRIIDLVPGATVRGDVHLGDENVRAPELEVVALRRRVGLIFQNPTPFPQSIRANLDFPLREHGVHDRNEREERIEASLREVGLWDEVRGRLGRNALALSGGQQQRLCIARALVLRPEVLLMDEPCSALDPLSGGVVEDLIRSLRGRYSVLIVTHNLAQARRVADHAAFFWPQEGVGRLIESAPAQDFFERPRNPVTALYLSGARG